MPRPALDLGPLGASRPTFRRNIEIIGCPACHTSGAMFVQTSLQRTFSLPSHIDFLDRALTRTGARLVVIDPVVAFLDRGILTASARDDRQPVVIGRPRSIQEARSS